jgi:hypothetical protein
MYAVNQETHEVFERTPDKLWKLRLDAWIKCRQARKCDYHRTALPSPMPYGHVMFDRRRKCGTYKPTATMPVPVWSDGIGAVYEGQRVGWECQPNFRGGPPNWMYGVVLRFEDGKLIIRRTDGGICAIDPYNLA